MINACLYQNREADPTFSPVGFIYSSCPSRFDLFLLHHLVSPALLCSHED